MNDREFMFQARNISSGYAKKQVLYDVSLSVKGGEIVAVLGHNGAGKTTLLKALVGFLPLYQGTIWFDKQEMTRLPYWKRIAIGMTFIPAEAPVFRDLTVQDNLELGAFTVRDSKARRSQMDVVFTLFPILAERRHQPAGALSGGQQRMLALGIALMARPKLMLLDEPSLGLAPNVVQSFFEQVRWLATNDHLAIILVEQNVRAALRIADRAYFIRNGQIILEEAAEKALARGKWWDLF